MKSLKRFIVGVAILIASSSQSFASTAWNWGGYVPSVDTPVIGGYLIHNYPYGGILVRGFGMIAYTGTATFGWSGSSGNIYVGLNPTCPENTANIAIAGAYKRPDTLASWDGLYNPAYILITGTDYYTTISGFSVHVNQSTNAAAWWYAANGDATTHLCVKTDTY